MRRMHARAIHIGADVLAGPGHAHLGGLPSCRDTLARMTRLARAAGIQEQRWLAGTQATRAAVTESLARGATALAPDGLLVVTFAGHTVRHHDQTFWCLHDGELPLGALAACLAGAAAQEQESMALELSREALVAIVGGMMNQKWLMDMTPY